MSRRLLVAAVLLGCLTMCGQQATDPNGGVFVGGPKYKKDKRATSRTLKGTVTDDSGKPIRGALVTLTNESSGTKLTFITKEDGRFRFDGLSFTIDYTVQARSNQLHSEIRKLSQYDRAPEMVRVLELHE